MRHYFMGFLSGTLVVGILFFGNAIFKYEKNNFSLLEKNPQQYLSNYIFSEVLIEYKEAKNLKERLKKEFGRELTKDEETNLKEFQKFTEYTYQKYLELKQKGLVNNPNLVIIDTLCQDMKYQRVDANGKKWVSQPVFCKNISSWERVIDEYNFYSQYTPWSLEFFTKSEFGIMKPVIPTYKMDLMQLEMIKATQDISKKES